MMHGQRNIKPKFSMHFLSLSRVPLNPAHPIIHDLTSPVIFSGYPNFSALQ